MLESLQTLAHDDCHDRQQLSTPDSEGTECKEPSRPQRRRQIDPTTCERDYSNDEIEFMRALDAYKRQTRRMFPTCSEILEVIRSLGYVRVSPSGSSQPPAISHLADASSAREESEGELDG